MRTILSAVAMLAIGLTTANASDWNTYEVTITNATKSQVITPPLITLHRNKVSVFAVGETASDGLSMLAETGDNQVLYSEINNAHGVFDTVASSDMIPPGESLSLTISGPKKAHLSVAAMLATTNDAFVGVNGVRISPKNLTIAARAYDAGSEMNNELCSHIPGPPCAPDSGNASTGGGEGFISIHNGVHGIGDIDASSLDWRGPVALVSIKRVKRKD